MIMKIIHDHPGDPDGDTMRTIRQESVLRPRVVYVFFFADRYLKAEDVSPPFPQAPILPKGHQHEVLYSELYSASLNRKAPSASGKIDYTYPRCENNFIPAWHTAHRHTLPSTDASQPCLIIQCSKPHLWQCQLQNLIAYPKHYPDSLIRYYSPDTTLFFTRAAFPRNTW